MLHRKPTPIVIFVFLAVMILAAGCVAGQPLIQVQAPPQTDTAEVAAAVDAIWQEYVDSRLAGDAERAMAIWDEEGVQMPPDTAPRVGKAAISAAVTASLERVTYLEMEVVPEELSVSGDIAISRGHYTVTRVAKAGGDPVFTDGKFMTFIRRQPDGSWKIYRDIFNSNVPPDPAPAATTDNEDVTAAVEALWREYEASIEAGDADRWGELWVEDGVKYPPDAPLLEGKEAIVNDMRGFMAAATTEDVAITNHDVQVVGDYAFARGVFRADNTLKANGMPMVMDGKYMSILQRQPDGSWKIYRDIFNANVPPNPAPAATTDNEDVTAAVEAIWDEYEAAQMASDPERWIALWTEDGVKMPPNGPAIEGKEGILARVQRGMTNAPVDEMVITSYEVQSAGDWAYSRGIFTGTYTIADTGVQEAMDGKFMTILQHQPDGSWKIHRDIHNDNAPPAPTNVDEVAAAINANWREYEASILAGDPERWIALWVDDGVQMPPGVPPNVGKEKILAGITEDLATYEYTEFVISNEDVEVDGDLAFARGTYVVGFAPKSGGDTMHVDGKYMTIFRHQPDGSWKIYRDIFNSNVP